MRRGSPWRKYASYFSGSRTGRLHRDAGTNSPNEKSPNLGPKRLELGDVAQTRGELSLRRTRRVRRKNSSERPRLNSEALTHSLPLISASRLNPSMSLAPLRLHSQRENGVASTFDILVAIDRSVARPTHAFGGGRISKPYLLAISITRGMSRCC